MKRWILPVVLIFLCCSSLVVNVFCWNEAKHKIENSMNYNTNGSQTLNEYDETVNEEMFLSYVESINEKLEENNQLVEELKNEIYLLEDKIDNQEITLNYLINDMIRIERTDLFRYLIYMAMIGDVGQIERFNAIAGTNYEVEWLQHLSDSLRTMFPPSHHVRISVGENQINIVDADTSIALVQKIDSGGRYGFDGGLEYIDFVYYGVENLCISINTKDAQMLMDIFGEDGIDDIDTAQNIIEVVSDSFQGEVIYDFVGMESDEDIYYFDLMDGTNTYRIDIKVVDGVIGVFDLGMLIE